MKNTWFSYAKRHIEFNKKNYVHIKPLRGKKKSLKNKKKKKTLNISK